MKLETLFDLCLLSNKIKVEYQDEQTRYLKDFRQAKQILQEKLKEEDLNLLQKFEYYLSCHLFEIKDNETRDMLHLGIRIGAELEKANSDYVG